MSMIVGMGLFGAAAAFAWLFSPGAYEYRPARPGRASGRRKPGIWPFG